MKNPTEPPKAMLKGLHKIHTVECNNLIAKFIFIYLYDNKNKYFREFQPFS